MGDMELAALGSVGVLRDADVTVARERTRQRRLRYLTGFLALVAVVVVGRTVAGFAHRAQATRAFARATALEAHAQSLLDKAWLPGFGAHMKYRFVGTSMLLKMGAAQAHVAAQIFYAKAQAQYAAAQGDFNWFHVGIPSSYVPYMPGFVLVLVLAVTMAGPLLMAGRSPHVLYRPEELNVRLSDVVGAGAVVEEVVKTLNLFLAHRTFSERMGGNARRAILFEGPPGTGKTYIAKAMAAEAGVPFLFVSSSAFQSMYYGQTNRKIRSYFRALQNYARKEGGAVGFIEEIDAIGAARGGMGAGPGREGVAGVVNELLIQLQSFDVPPRQIRMVNAVIDSVNRWLPQHRAIRKRVVAPANFLVIGATNRAADLDPALLRPGRFDRTIRVDVPNRDGRREVLDYYLAKKAHVAELDEPEVRDTLAGSTFGYSPVMLEHLLDEALVWALRSGRSAMTLEDVHKARLTQELGMTQPVVYTPDERVAIATHEAGHATVAYFCAPSRRLDVLSIIKRSESLGLLGHSESQERFTRTRSECISLLQVSMGGMVAEEVFFGEAGTGPSGDLAAATQLAAQMVGTFGMGGSLVSLDAAHMSGNIVSKVLSDESSRRALEGLLDAAKAAARQVIEVNSHVVEALRDALLRQDELVGAEITAVITAAVASGPHSS
ncbi:MAG TPA: AAA family ATPase, partial [Acidimicrobiales bacterium]|nr:AAA family ATPase [Acidimicrobiales bacterium]